MVHIKKVKTFHGIRYAVVDSFTSTTVIEDRNGNKSVKTTTKDYPVEYKTGTGHNERIVPAVFPVTVEGLAKAKEVQKLFKNKSKKQLTNATNNGIINNIRHIQQLTYNAING